MMTLDSNNKISLTDEQRAALETLVPCKHDVQTMGGFAGTGKTTVIRELVNRLPGFAVCAYTGKATQVLRRKGVPASTIHSLIYLPVVDDDGSVTFELRAPWEFDHRGIIVDEGSMVPRPIYDDLLKFGVPLIFVGDHGQLEPVGGGDFNLMASPQVTLQTIHRNAGEIALFAEHLRKGNSAEDWDTAEGVDDDDDDSDNLHSPQVRIIRSDQLGGIEDIDRECQMICAYNKTRVSLNKLVRETLEYEPDPCVGDRVICLQNDRESQVFNGMQGILTKIDRSRLTFDVGDDKRPPITVRYNRNGFGAERTPERVSGLVPFDWAYCITCHKSQGDEFDHVVVVEQHCSAWDHRRWSYTAASRAKNRLTWVLE